MDEVLAQLLHFSKHLRLADLKALEFGRQTFLLRHVGRDLLVGLKTLWRQK